jgi:hypothetical protein
MIAHPLYSKPALQYDGGATLLSSEHKGIKNEQRGVRNSRWAMLSFQKYTSDLFVSLFRPVFIESGLVELR